MSAMIDHLLAGDAFSREFYESLTAATPADWPQVLELAHHPDPQVRLAMVSTLSTLDDPPRAEWVQEAIRLTKDPNPRVRDWACFELAEQWREIDTPALRDALAARLDDLDREVRDQALVGLAYRHDERALPRVRAALTRASGDVWRLEMIAAGALGDPSLHPFVLRHLDGWDDDLWVDAVRRLTDPAGPGADVFRGVAQLYAARAHGRPDPASGLAALRLMNEMLEIAPERERAFYTATAARLRDDPAGFQELAMQSELPTLGFTPRRRRLDGH